MFKKVNGGIWRNLKLEIMSTDAWVDSRKTGEKEETLTFSKWHAIKLSSGVRVCLCMREIWEH